MRSLLCLVLVAAGCGDDETNAFPQDLSMAVNADLSVNVADLSVAVRGPVELPLDFEPVGLYWDAPALYISTGSNQIIQWTDAGGFALIATVPFAFAAQGNNLSQLVHLADGRIVVDVIGLNGTSAVNGNILIYDNGQFSAVPNLNQKRQRQGLALAPNGTLYSSWFQGTGAMMPLGGISKVDLTAGETDVWLGLQKPFGVAVDGTTIYAADQKQNAIFELPLSSMDADGGAAVKLCDLTSPDLMALALGDLYVGGPQLTLATPDGKTTDYWAPPRNTRGVAFDLDHLRLFAAEPDARFPDAGVMASLLIMPVN